jgi:hypothetical protein
MIRPSRASAVDGKSDRYPSTFSRRKISREKVKVSAMCDPTRADTPALVLFYRTGCPACDGLPGRLGPLAIAAGKAGVEYRELERSSAMAQYILKLGHPLMPVTSYPAIGLLTPKGRWYPYPQGAPRTPQSLVEWLLGLQAARVRRERNERKGPRSLYRSTM